MPKLRAQENFAFYSISYVHGTGQTDRQTDGVPHVITPMQVLALKLARLRFVARRRSTMAHVSSRYSSKDNGVPCM